MVLRPAFAEAMRHGCEPKLIATFPRQPLASPPRHEALHRLPRTAPAWVLAIGGVPGAAYEAPQMSRLGAPDPLAQG